MNEAEFNFIEKILNDSNKIVDKLLKEVKKYTKKVGIVESRKCVAELWKYGELTLLVPVKGPCRRWKIFRGQTRLIARYAVPVLALFLYMITHDERYYDMTLAYFKGYQEGADDMY